MKTNRSIGNHNPMQVIAWLCCLIIILISAAGPVRPAWAALGGREETIEADREKLSGNRKSVSHSEYTVEAIQTTGLSVQEYVAPDGTVFAVTWTGNRIPDLAGLFGDYFQEYEKALADWRAQTPPRRGPIHLKGARLIVDTGGRTPQLWGRAYVPSLLPQGITPEEIQ